MTATSDLRKAYDALTLDNLRRYSRFTVYVNLAAAIAVAGATLLQFITADKYQPSHVIGMAVACIALLLTSFQVLLNNTASAEIALAQNVLGKAEELERELFKERTNVEQERNDIEETFSFERERLFEANEMLAVLGFLHEGIEQSLDKGARLPHAFPDIIKASTPSLRRALRFDLNQAYAVNIYEARKSGDATRLYLVAHVRSTDCDIKRATTWADGEGVAGHCYRTNKLVPIDDSSDKSVQTIVSSSKIAGTVTPASFLAYPIRAGKPDAVWGVVVASNSDPGHFRSDGGDESPDSPAGRLKLFAGALALAVQAHEAANFR